MCVLVKRYCLLLDVLTWGVSSHMNTFPVTHQLCQSLRGKRGGGETFAKIFVIYPLIRWQQLLAIKMCHSLLGIHVVNIEMDSTHN